MMDREIQFFRSVWLWSLGFFLLAALTGFLFRYSMITGDTFGLRLSNIRHAHSHLMFFNWVTPVPMMFIVWHILKKVPEAMSQFKWIIGSAMAIGFASFPFFLLYGYHSVQLGSAELPFSVILSGLVMIVWYWFMWVYLRYRNRSDATLSRLFYDGSLIMLGISSLGAWGVAVIQFGEIDNNLLSAAMTHFFLTSFTEGWCILAAVGILYQFTDTKAHNLPFDSNWLIGPLVLGVPLMFPFGLSSDLLTPDLLWTARMGAGIVGLGLAVNAFILFRNFRRPLGLLWSILFLLFGLKIAFQLGAALVPSVLWAGQHGVRVLYLHLLLLGFVSVLYFIAFQKLTQSGSIAGTALFTGGVIILLLTLVPISGLWPIEWQIPNLYQIVTAGAILPSVGIAVEWVQVWRNRSISGG
jgi:hypothetical protein